MLSCGRLHSGRRRWLAEPSVKVLHLLLTHLSALQERLRRGLRQWGHTRHRDRPACHRHGAGRRELRLWHRPLWAAHPKAIGPDLRERLLR